MKSSGSREVERLIERILTEAGFDPDSESVAKFSRYLEELRRWNRTHNLTSVKTDREIITRHFLDSLSLVRCFEDLGVDWRGKSIADVGAGAGFPGCPLKIYLKDIKLTLIESSAKKCSFLEFLKTVLGEEWRVECQRAEDIDESFDIVVSRALGDFSKTHNLLERLSRGYIFIMKGKDLEREMIRELGYRIYRVSIKGLPEYYILYRVLSPPSR